MEFCYVLLREKISFGSYDKTVTAVSLDKNKLIQMLKELSEDWEPSGYRIDILKDTFAEIVGYGFIVRYNIESAKFK